MTRHLLKLVWNRKGANALITLEIFLSLLVVSTLTILATYHWRNFVRPMGFDIERAWKVSIGAELRTAPPDEIDATAHALAREVEALDEVEHAGLLARAPYSSAHWVNTVDLDDGRRLRCYIEQLSPAVREVLGIRVLQGRWLEEADRGLDWTPVVVNKAMAEAYFGSDDPLGKSVMNENDGDPVFRVVGVVDDYRRRGELTPEWLVAIVPLRLDKAEDLWSLELVLKVKPGIDATFEEKLIRTMERVTPSTWSFAVKPLDLERETYLEGNLTPLLVVAIVAAFLIAMVALGLVGVLWQNVTQRTREMGLRRAKGATARAVRRQILVEVVLMTTFAVLLAAVVVVQLPLTGFFASAELADYAVGFVLATAVIYLLTALCGLYPSWLATRISPAEALHYE